MNEIKYKTIWCVDVMQYNLYRGCLLDESKFFDSEEEAIQYVEDYSSKYKTFSFLHPKQIIVSTLFRKQN